MSKRRLMVYLDPGFLENRGHYMNFSKHVHAEAERRGIELRHFVNAGTSKDFSQQHRLAPVFARAAYLADGTRAEDVLEVAQAIDAGFGRIIESVAATAREFDEIVYYMYTGHPTYLSSLARHLARHSHGGTPVAAHVVLFYLSDMFCYGTDDGRYAHFLSAVSAQLEALDPQGRIRVGIDSDTAVELHARRFARPVQVVPFPHVQRAEAPPFPVKSSAQSGRPRVSYTGYPHGKYGFDLVLALLEQSLSDPLWKEVEFELKINERVKEYHLVERWDALKGRLGNITVHEGYMEDADYLAMIGRADVLLIPYNSQYNHDTSAVLVDGLFGGCIVVAAEPSWMANVFSQHGSGRSYAPDDAASFIAATRDVVSNLADYQARTMRNIQGMAWKFSAEGLFDTIFPRWRTVLPAAPQDNPAPAAGVAQDLILPPVMIGTNSLLEDRMSEDELKEELAVLTRRLSALNKEFLPGESVTLPQRIADLKAIVAAVDDADRDRRRFEALAATRKADRCVLIGPDVSLDAETIKALKDEIVFVPQQTYRQFRNTNTTPAFLVLETGSFIRSNIEDIRKLTGTTMFAPFHCAHVFSGQDDVIHFNHQPRKSYPDGYDISLRAQDVTYTSCTVVGTALQIAMSLGFRQICLLGVDIREGCAEHAELDKLYSEVARTAVGNGILVVNVGIDMQVPHIAFADIEPFVSPQRRARAVLAEATSGRLDRNWSADELAIAERVLLSRHPCPSDIYLPTTKYQGVERVAAIRKVVTAWNDRQEVHRARLQEAKRRMQGRQRCFIIGNGPSLNQTNLDLLVDDVTFATNGIFLKFADTKFRPTFFVVEDHLVGEDRYREINELTGFTKLAPYYLGYCLEDGEDVIYYNHRGRKSYPDGFDFSTNAEEITYTGCTVTFSCMQLAYYMGFKEIYLIGVDMSYVIPQEVKTSKEYDTDVLDMDIDDPNHFIPNYFGRGYRWHDPNVDKMEQAYIEARKVTELNGVKIYNATIGGKCEVFDRVDYYSLFGKSEGPAVAAVASLAAMSAEEGPVPGSALATLYAMPAGLTASVPVSRILKPENAVDLSLTVSRFLPMLLIVEIEAMPAEFLAGLSVEVDGVVAPCAFYLDQTPALVKIVLPPRSSDGPTRVAIRTAITDGAGGRDDIRIDSVTMTPQRSHLKGLFPLSHFDGIGYLEENPDVARSVAAREVLSALSHYLAQGKGEGRRLYLAATRRPNSGYRYELPAT